MKGIKKAMVYGYAILVILSALFVVMGQGPISTNRTHASDFAKSTSDYLFVVPVEDHGYAPMIKHLIDGAKTSVYVAMEELKNDSSVKSLLNSLINAENRGVDVKVIYQDSMSDSNAVNYLSSNGVSVKSGGNSKFIHDKLIVIDGQVVYVGSHNWSPSALEKNNEYGAIIYNKSIAGFYDQYFLSLWSNADSTPSLTNMAINNAGMWINTTYDGYTYNALNSLINSATKRLYVAMYTMAYYSSPNTDEERVNTLVNDIVAKKSIAKVVLETHNENAWNYLHSNGVNVKNDSSSVITHLKLVIADDSVYIGDANWDTEYFNNDTHTVGVIVHNKTIADYFASFFNVIYKYGNVPYYIPSPFVDTWTASAPAGGYATINVYIANGGYKNGTYFYLKPIGPLWSDIGKYPSWYRNSVYDWRSEKLYVEVPSSASSGMYTVGLRFYSKDHVINYTMYFKITVSGSGGSVPIANHLLITEVYYDDASSYSKYRFVELYNPTSKDINLDGYKLVNVSSGHTYTIHGLKIHAHSHVTIASTAYYFAERFGKYPDIGDGSQHNLEISAHRGGIALRAPDNTTVIDAVYWGGYNGWNVNSGKYDSIVRVPYDWDNDSAQQWVGSQRPYPWVQSLSDKVVLIDRGHKSYFSSRIGDFVVKLREIGLNPENFTATSGQHSNISADLLNTSTRPLAKLIVITDPARKLSSQEIENISNFVNNFNGSVLLSSESDYGNYSHPQNLNAILEALSSTIRFNDDEVLDSTNNSGASYKPIIHHFNDTTGEVAHGVSEVEFKSSCSLVDASGGRLKEGGGVILFATGDNDTYNKDADGSGDAYIYTKGSYIPVAAGEIMNKHRIAALGATIFQDGADGIQSTYDNALFTTNLVKWLMGIKSVSLGNPELSFANNKHENASMIISVSTANAESVTINYTTDGTHYFESAMYDDGTHGDAISGDGTYSFILPNYTSGTHVRVKIMAEGTDSTADTSLDYYAMPQISWVRNNTAEVVVEGKITVKPGSFSKAIYIQDESAGVEIYGLDLSSLNLNYGDYVKVVGEATTYHGDVEIKISSAMQVKKTVSGNPVEPMDISIALANSTNYGKLVRVSGIVKNINSTGHYFYLDDGSGHAVRIYLKNRSIDISSLHIGDSITVVGVQAQYGSTYEIVPREQSDINSSVPELSWYIAILLALFIVAAKFKK